MTYVLGVDLGTTFTAAAICKNGRVSIASLGNQSAAIPSVLLLKDDATILTGDAANRRGMTEPERVARDFKRRVGDTTPIFLGGTPQSAEALMARLLRWVADEVTAREGAAPSHVAVCHPANWGRYKQDLLAQAVRMADLGVATFVTEPEAAAIFYASEQQVDPGKVVAVYDLGGGTFDAAILRKTEDSFEILGRPEGIERLGGIDFDAAVFAHVARSLQGKLAELDEDDPVAMSAVARLRQECVEAKEALSTDSDVSISVLLPNVQTEVRLTRSEFEDMIRPSLADTIGAMRRAFASADLTADDVSAVLLVGGSSRIPLVAQLVGAELGRPVAVDTHPKHAVALGTAYAAAAAADGTPATGSPAVAPDQAPAPAPPAQVDVPAAAPVVTPPPAPVVAPVVAGPEQPDAAEVPPVVPAVVPATADVPAAAPPAAAVPEAAVAYEPPPGLPVSGADDGAGSQHSRKPLVLAVAGVTIFALVGGGAFALTRGDGGRPTAATPGVTSTGASTDTDTSTGTGNSTSTGSSAEPVSVPVDRAALDEAIGAAHNPAFSSITVDVDGGLVTLRGLAFGNKARTRLREAARSVAGVTHVKDETVLETAGQKCTGTIMSKDTWACLSDVVWDGEKLTAQLAGSASADGAPLSLQGFHLHFFGDNVDPATAGVAGPYSVGGGKWRVWDQPTVFEGTLAEIGSPDGVPDQLCVRVANGNHQLEQLDSGNCWPVTDLS